MFEHPVFCLAVLLLKLAIAFFLFREFYFDLKIRRARRLAERAEYYELDSISKAGD